MYHESIIKKKNAVLISGLHEGWKLCSGGGSLKILERRQPQTFSLLLVF
jgi:hypothetical protein